MTVDPLAVFYVHTATVARKSATGAYGDVLDDPADVIGFWSDGERLVTTAGGRQVTATATFAFPIDVDPIPLGSRVTAPAEFGGRECVVVATARADLGALPGAPSHCTVDLT